MKKLLTALFGFIIFYNLIVYVIPAVAAEKKSTKPPQQPQQIEVTINNKGTLPLNYYHYQPTILKPGAPSLTRPTLSQINAGASGNFSVNLIPRTGRSILTYGYDQNNFCKFALSFTGILVVGAMRHGTAKCDIINSSENSVAINITTLLAEQQHAAARAAARAAAQAAAQATAVAEGAYCAQEQGNNSTFALFSDGTVGVITDNSQSPSPQNCSTFERMSGMRADGASLGHYTLDRTHQKMYISWGDTWSNGRNDVSPCTYTILNNKIQTISIPGIYKGVYQRQ